MPTYTWRNVAIFILRVSEVRPDGKDVYIFIYVNIFLHIYLYIKYISLNIYLGEYIL